MENRKRNEPRKNGARFEVPLLVPSDNLMISHRIFRSEFETDDYLLDADDTREIRSFYLEFASEGDSNLIDNVNVQTVSR